MRRYALREDQWEKIKPLLPGKEEDPGRTAKDNRLFLEAVSLYKKSPICISISPLVYLRV